MKEYNVSYALYNAKDEYIAGFNTLVEMSLYLGNSKPTLSNALNKNKQSRGEIMRNKSDEENKYDCSQKLFTYTNNVITIKEENLGKGCSIYKFWEEKISRERENGN